MKMQMTDEDIMAQLDITEEMRYRASLPWWSRTMLGRTGAFGGHAIPGSFYLLAACFLFLALHRSRSIPRGQTYTELHVPERCPWVLSGMGISVLVATAIGIIFETCTGLYFNHNPFFNLTHLTLYFSYSMVGMCALLEAKGKVPLDSHRAVAVVALLTSAIMWYTHGTMKLLMTDQLIHILLSYVNLANAAVVAYSMRFTDSAIAFIGGYALLVLQGMWLWTAAFYECCFDLPMHDIATYLSVQCLTLVFAIMLAVAIWGPDSSEQDDPSYRKKFSMLKEMDDDAETYGDISQG